MAVVKFFLNEEPVKCDVDVKEVLTDTDRMRFGLTGTNKACCTGDCKACTVLLNGKAIRSCNF